MQSTNTKISAPIDEILLPAQAAAFLGVTEEQLHNAVCQGYLPGACIDGQWRFSKRALIDLLRAPRFGMDDLPELVLGPDNDYAEAWSTCIAMRRSIEAVQKLMLSGHDIHELVASPRFRRVYETYSDFYRQTEAREEELEYQIFRDIEKWVQNARSYYWNFELSLCTCIDDGIPQYELRFKDRLEGEEIFSSERLPVQTEWMPLEVFWKDSRRYDFS